jgi:cell division protein FtsL
MKFNMRTMLAFFPWIACALLVVKSCDDGRRLADAERERDRANQSISQWIANWDGYTKDADRAEAEHKKARDEYFRLKLQLEESAP